MNEGETGRSVQETKARKSPTSKAVHDAVLQEAIEELARPAAGMAWSGVAAGLSMGFSFLAEGLLHAHLPDVSWRPLVSKLGYSVGFLIVILGRQQLFTENTLTPVLPLLQNKTTDMFLKVARLWLVVLGSNLLGAAAIGWTIPFAAAFEPHVHEALIEIARKALEVPFLTILLRGIFAGWLIALIVWMMPYAGSARALVIILLTYVIGLGNMSHVVAGSIEGFALATAGETTWSNALLRYTLPSLIGNVIGGVALVAGLNRAQVFAGQKP